MRKGWVWLLVAACFLLVVVLAGIGLSAAPRPLGPTQRLPNGTLVTPLGFTVGDTKHRWIEGTALQRIVARIVPASAGAIGAEVHEYTTPNATTPVLWMRYAGGNPGRGYHPTRITSADSDGCDSVQNSGGGTYGNGSSAETLEAIPLTPYNRRDSEIRLRFYTFAHLGWRQDAEFRLPNPLFSTALGWAPRPLPAVATDGPLTVTLDDVITRCDMSDPPRPAQPGEDDWTCFRAHSAENGRRSVNWGISNVEFADAAGNQGSIGAGSSNAADGEIRAFMRSTLCPREPAWKVRLEMSRRAGFAPGELWVLKNVPVPGDKERKAVGQRTVLQGVTLECPAFYGTDVQREAGVILSGMSALHVKAAGWHPGLRMTLVSVTDQQGRKVESRMSSFDGKGAFAFGLHPDPGARSLTVTLAVSPSRYVEFLVHPSLPVGAAPAR